MAITKAAADAFLAARAQRVTKGAEVGAKARLAATEAKAGTTAGTEAAQAGAEGAKAWGSGAAAKPWKSGAAKPIPVGTAVESFEVPSQMTREGAFRAVKEAADLHGAAHIDFNGQYITALRGQGLDVIKAPFRQQAADRAVARLRTLAQEDAGRTERVQLFKQQGGVITDAHPAGLRGEGFMELENPVHVRPFAIKRLTQAQYDALPKGSRLYQWDGAEHIKGVDSPYIAEHGFIPGGVPAETRVPQYRSPPGTLSSAQARLAWSTIDDMPKGGERSHTTYIAQALETVTSPHEIAVLARQLTADVSQGFRHPDAIREATALVRDPAARVQWDAVASQLRVPKARPTRGTNGKLELDFNKPVQGLPRSVGHVQEALDVAYQAVKDRKQPILFRFKEYAFEIRPDHRRDELTALFKGATAV